MPKISQSVPCLMPTFSKNVMKICSSVFPIMLLTDTDFLENIYKKKPCVQGVKHVPLVITLQPISNNSSMNGSCSTFLLYMKGVCKWSHAFLKQHLNFTFLHFYLVITNYNYQTIMLILLLLLTKSNFEIRANIVFMLWMAIRRGANHNLIIYYVCDNADVLGCKHLPIP